MPTLPTSADRAAEFNRLLVEQATVTRSMKYGWKPDEEQRAAIDARATRLLELAQLIHADAEPGRYVNDRIAAWLRMNPLPLEPAVIVDAVEHYADGTCPLEGVRVQIGPVDGGYGYRAMRDDFQLSFTGGVGVAVVNVPDSVAEHFRQQGRRALQSEMRALLNASRA